ncbi:MAG: FkbM family methyltransferase [Lachnospiraceae bacterium]|nr:FkbM family methyltransferase [Lachnospiraceae bacterium]
MISLEKYQEIIIWGACLSPEEIGGDATSPGYASEKLYGLLQSNGYADRIIFYVDSNKNIQGRSKYGREIVDPARILEYPHALVIICSISQMAIMKAIENMHAGNDCLFVPYYFLHGTAGHPYNKIYAKEYLEAHRHEINKFYDTTDQHTKKCLNIIFKSHESEEDDLYTKEFFGGTGAYLDYFGDADIAPKGDVTYIDVGAFCGETIEPVRKMYQSRLKKCIAFEPNESSREKLQAYVTENSLGGLVDIFPYALGNKNCTISFFANGGISKIVEDGHNGEIEQLEQRVFDQLPDIDLVGELMVKMDIEGAELGALEGMRQLIQQHQPYLAICVYHREGDIYDIPHYLHSLYPGYRFYLRSGWHLECWAVPERHFRG